MLLGSFLAAFLSVVDVPFGLGFVRTYTNDKSYLNFYERLPKLTPPSLSSTYRWVRGWQSKAST